MSVVMPQIYLDFWCPVIKPQYFLNWLHTVWITVKQLNVKFKILCFNLGFQTDSIDVFQILSSMLNFKIIYTAKRIDFLNMRDMNIFHSCNASNAFFLSFPLRFRVLSSKVLVGKKKSLVFSLSKLSFLPRILSSGGDAVFSTGFTVWQVRQWVWPD